MAVDDPGPPVTSHGHVDFDTLAEYDAECFDGPVAAAIASHTSTCPDCQEVLAALTAVRADLANLPAPSIPPDVAARVGTALDAERLAEPAGAGVIEPPVWRRRWREAKGLMLTAAAASVVVLVGLTFAATRLTADDGGTHTIVDAGAGRNAPADTPEEATNTSATTGFEPPTGDHSSATVPPLDPLTPRLDPPSTTGGDQPSDAATGTGPSPGTEPGGTLPDLPHYTPGTIVGALGDILSRATCVAGCDSELAGAMADQGRLDRCVGALSALVPDRGLPTAVQYVLFDNLPAYALVFDDNTVVVVRDDCGTTDEPTILFSE